MAQLKTYLKTMEVQVGQIAQDANRRQQGNLPSDTVSTSRGKDQCNAVALRSGKQIQPIGPPLHKGTSQECRDEEEDVEEVYSDPEPLSPRQPVITHQEEMTHPNRPETEGVQPHRDEHRGEVKRKVGERRVSFELDNAVKVSDPKPPPPFPVARKKKTKAK